MKDIATKFFALSTQARRKAILSLCDRVLDVWESQYAPGTHPTYQESITGSIQILDVGLPRDALASIRAGADNCKVAERYKEPVVALQDLDLELPDSAEFAYYAIYNAFCIYVLQASVDEKLVLNQALSSLPECEIKGAFCSAVENAG